MLKDLAIVDTVVSDPVTIDIVSNLPVVTNAPAVVEVKKPAPVLGRKSLKIEVPIVEEWLTFLKDFSGLKSAQSEKTYRNAIGQMLNWFKDNDKNIASATTADVRMWRDTLKLDKDTLKLDKSPATVELYLVAARLFFAWLCNEGIIKQNPCNVGGLNLKSGVKVEREHKRSDLSVEQIREMLDAMPANSEMELRNRAVVALMCTAGDVWHCEPNTPITHGQAADDVFQLILDEITKNNTKPNSEPCAEKQKNSNNAATLVYQSNGNSRAFDTWRA